MCFLSLSLSFSGNGSRQQFSNGDLFSIIKGMVFVCFDVGLLICADYDDDDVDGC